MWDEYILLLAQKQGVDKIIIRKMKNEENIRCHGKKIMKKKLEK